MRVFISDLTTTLGQELVRHCQDADIEVVGTVPHKSHWVPTKLKLLDHAANDKPDALKEPLAVASDRAAWTWLVQRSDVVITSLAAETKQSMELLKAMELNEDVPEEEYVPAGVRKFVAISSVLTWTKNPCFAKESSADGPVPHKEDDFKTRKPARKYAELKTAETQILSANREGELETCLVAAGLIYGGAQTQFQLIFRDAWMHPTTDLLVPAVVPPPHASGKNGTNTLPMISVYDLAILTFKIATAPSAPKNYIVATDKASRTTTLRDVCLGVSILLTTGKLRDVESPEQADDLLVREDDGLVAPLQIHLCFDSATSDASAMNQLVAAEEWRHLDGGLLGNLEYYVDDFIQCLDLRPLKTVVLGPPRVGKTTLSQQLAKQYYLPLLSPDMLVAEVFASARPVASDEEQQSEQQPAEDDATLDDEVRKLREDLREWRDAQKPVCDLPEAALIALARWKLASAPCRNQGYVLDGLPLSAAQAQRIFEPLPAPAKAPAENEGSNGGEDGKQDGDNGESPEGGDGTADGEGKTLSKSRSQKLLAQLRPLKQIQFPNRVVVLNSTRELLEKRAQLVSEAEAVATANTQAAFDVRYSDYVREIDAITTFFEQRQQQAKATADAATQEEGAEDGDADAAADGKRANKKLKDESIEVLELQLDTEECYRDSDAYNLSVKKYLEQGGQGRAPNNFHPTKEELQQWERELVAKRKQDADHARQLELEQEEKDANELQARMAADRARLELIHAEEAELLEARAKPLRTYLMDTVLPALTEGMLEVVKVQPDDPIDYLAEFLFKKGMEMEAKGT
ncbi:TPA: hypothetical protein N0F65_009326 [Lagenidium giganteum]|uniref:Adenylate kinase n=1 Tax=Lagenidium giganteum TaxID=4803 RepID=A0AAV2YT59_9STRA|nr:TPA: hypothetical protein N0F65_009326 [Lagenidium giganteum]